MEYYRQLLQAAIEEDDSLLISALNNLIATLEAKEAISAANISTEKFNALMANIEAIKLTTEQAEAQQAFPDEDEPDCECTCDTNFNDVASTSQSIKSILYTKMQGQVDPAILEATDQIVSCLSEVANGSNLICENFQEIANYAKLVCNDNA